MIKKEWLGKPYYSLDAYCKSVYGEKCYKIALDAGLTCPNRDGRIGTGGCIFCSEGGSGDYAQIANAYSIRDQLQKGRDTMTSKEIGTHYIAYFQAYTNTYGPVNYLWDIFLAALCQPDIVGISIATRPDCLGEEILSMLKDLKTCYPDKFVWIELGLQTIHEATAAFVHRKYSLPTFEKACSDLRAINVPYIVHLILGLPRETPEMMYQTCEYLNQESIHPFGVKLQLLHVLKNTVLGKMYQTKQLPDFHVLEQDEYLSILIHCLELLSPDIVIHRVTGDGPRDLVIAPLWSLNKRNVLNTLHKDMQQQNTYQGRCYHGTGATDSL